jgi:hypothetical protein
MNLMEFDRCPFLCLSTHVCTDAYVTDKVGLASEIQQLIHA